MVEVIFAKLHLVISTDEYDGDLVKLSCEVRTILLDLLCHTTWHSSFLKDVTCNF